MCACTHRQRSNQCQSMMFPLDAAKHAVQISHEAAADLGHSEAQDCTKTWTYCTDSAPACRHTLLQPAFLAQMGGVSNSSVPAATLLLQPSSPLIHFLSCQAD